MLETHIYIEISSRFQEESEKKYGYVMECVGIADTRNGFGTVKATYDRANLVAITEAINRFTTPCEIHIHTKNKRVLDHLERYLEKWAANEFRNAKGEPVHEEWTELWKQSQKHLLLTVPGEHPYSSWLLTEMKKEDTQNADRKNDNGGTDNGCIRTSSTGLYLH